MRSFFKSSSTSVSAVVEPTTTPSVSTTTNTTTPPPSPLGRNNITQHPRSSKSQHPRNNNNHLPLPTARRRSSRRRRSNENHHGTGNTTTTISSTSSSHPNHPKTTTATITNPKIKSPLTPPPHNTTKHQETLERYNTERRFRMACRNGDLDIVQECVVVTSVVPDDTSQDHQDGPPNATVVSVVSSLFHSTDTNGWTGLHHACHGGYDRIVQYILHTYQDLFVITSVSPPPHDDDDDHHQMSFSLQEFLSLPTKTEGNTPLHCAMEEGNESIVTFIMKQYHQQQQQQQQQVMAGSKTKDKDRDRHHQQQHDHRIWNIRNHQQETIYDIATRKNYFRMVHLLLSYTDESGNTTTARSSSSSSSSSSSLLDQNDHGSNDEISHNTNDDHGTRYNDESTTDIPIPASSFSNISSPSNAPSSSDRDTALTTTTTSKPIINGFKLQPPGIHCTTQSTLKTIPPDASTITTMTELSLPPTMETTIPSVTNKTTTLKDKRQISEPSSVPNSPKVTPPSDPIDPMNDDDIIVQQWKTQIFHAAQIGDYDSLVSLLAPLVRTNPQRYLHVVDDNGETILHHTCYHAGSLSIVQYIVEHDTNHHQNDDKRDLLIHRLSHKGETALDIAIQCMHYDVAEYLLTMMTSNPSDDGKVVATTTTVDEETPEVDHISDHEENAHPIDDVQKKVLQLDHSVTLMGPTEFQSDDSVTEREASHPAATTLATATTTMNQSQTATTLSTKEVQQWNEFFMSIIESGDLESVKQCIETGCIDITQSKTIDEVDGGYNDEYTALQLACMYDHYKMVRYFIEVAGMNVATKTGQHGSTILHIVTRAGAIKLLQYLIDSDKAIVDIECMDNDGKTALHWACRLGFFDIVTYLVECGQANYTAKDSNGYTPLQLASRNGRLDVVQYIAEQYIVDAAKLSSTTRRESDIHTAFWLACRYGQFPIVQYLIEKGGIKVNMKNESDGMTALHYASQYGAMQYVQFLCEDCHADIHMLDKLGESALDKANTYEHTEVVIYLTERYARIVKAAAKLRSAAKQGNLSAVIDCISNNRDVDIHAGGSTGKTALHYAIANGHYGIVHYLVQQCGANVNQRTAEGATPLHYACRYGQSKCVQLLCRKGCPVPVDASLVDHQNETALDKAKKNGHHEIVEFLENATINCVSNHIHNNDTDCPSDSAPVSVHRNSSEETKLDAVMVN